MKPYHFVIFTCWICILYLMMGMALGLVKESFAAWFAFWFFVIVMFIVTGSNYKRPN